MKVLFTPTHATHNPPHELELGHFVPFKESPARIDSILASLLSHSPTPFPILPPVDHGLAPILRVHTKEYVDYFREAYRVWVERGGNRDGVFPDAFAVRGFAREGVDGGVGGRPGYFCFDMTGIIAEGTFQAAYDAVQVAVTGCDVLMEKGEEAVFALCRPPGHHAHEDLCGGYCFFNNAAIATRYLIEEKQAAKVCILDLDYHHGNGTQVIFYADANPLYVSIHGSPDYPMYWGSESEVGEGEGKGFNVNVPLPIGTRDASYLDALKGLVEGRVSEFQADVLVVSLGVDTFVDDVVGHFLLTSECYLKIGALVARVGARKTLFVMEGGYDVAAIGTNVTNVLRGFEKEKRRSEK
ncbi:hypothetical protein HDU98_000427 [Podochytrium sp. JEL0797]|nr:hypothetical protein HDU98_000427 [Podochytrium sp. JEL0797]